MDSAGGNRPRRACSGDHAFAPDETAIEAGRFIWRKSHRGFEKRIRRSRSSKSMTTTYPVFTPPSAPAGGRVVDRCTAVILGAAGDLMKRKLMPAIYYLAEQKLLPKE